MVAFYGNKLLSTCLETIGNLYYYFSFRTLVKNQLSDI